MNQYYFCMIKIIKYSLIITSFLFLSSCASKIEQKDKTSKIKIENFNNSNKHEIHFYKNKHIDKWLEYFTVKDKKRFQRFIDKGFYYKELIQTQLEEDELPFLLYYLPLIESGFNNRAHSHAGAVGPWQFVRGTGRRYGLAVNSYIDERRDPILSTEAATKYLTDLYNVFHSWELAIAAYNCGEIRVLRAIMRGKTRDFWTLVDKKLLPRETRNYVPKFLAAAYIGENLEKFGFNVSQTSTYPDVELYEVPGGTKLKFLAKNLNLSEAELINLNPSLKYKKTPFWLKSYSLWLPPEQQNKLAVLLPKLRKNIKQRQIADTSRFYKVRRGDNLHEIARRNKISLNKLKRINNIRGSRIYPGQKLVLRTKGYKKVAGKKFYFVKKHDHLSKIARKYHLSVRYLKRLNGLHSNQIYIGQKIDVSEGVKVFNYKVRKGDNLHKISRLYNTSTYRIKRKNALRNNRIYVGQILKI